VILFTLPCPWHFASPLLHELTLVSIINLSFGIIFFLNFILSADIKYTNLPLLPNSKGAMGQLRTAARYKYESNMSNTLKDFHRDEVINNDTCTDEQLKSIVAYCERDALTLEHIFIEQLKDIQNSYPNYGPKTLILLF